MVAGSFVHCHLVTLVSIVGLTGTVLAFSWVDEDAFISFRYARNILDGHGPVFNIGERVQGYTHPLWLGFLTFGMAIVRSPIVISVVLGLINTVVFVALVGETLRRRGADRWLPRLLLVVLAQIYLASNSWIVFQSSGLENSLTNIFIAILVFEAFSKNPRPFFLSLSVALLLCSRLDHIAFVAPVAMVVAFQTKTLRGWAMIIAGAIPFLCWAAFSYAFYGTVTPNTATAKVGIWPWNESIEHGLRYLWDWIRIEPVAALGAFGLLIAGVTMSRRPLALAVAAGCFLYLAYVVFVGGDYMRGRFLVTFLVGATLFGASVLLAELPRRAISPKAVNAVCGGLIAIALAFIAVSGVPDARANRGIVNEWAVYNGLHFSSYIFMTATPSVGLPVPMSDTTWWRTSRPAARLRFTTAASVLSASSHPRTLPLSTSLA